MFKKSNFMDYIFYRIYLYYKKKDDLPVLTGILFLQVLKVSILFLIGSVFNILTHGFISTQNILKDKYWLTVGIVLISLFIIDTVRYGRKKVRNEIESKFIFNRNNKKIKLWQIFILPIIVIILSFTIIVVLR